MSKILSITLPLFYFSYIFFEDWQYVWVFRILTSSTVGASVFYLWTHDDLRKFIFKFLEIKKEKE